MGFFVLSQKEKKVRKCRALASLVIKFMCVWGGGNSPPFCGYNLSFGYILFQPSKSVSFFGADKLYIFRAHFLVFTFFTYVI